MNETGLCKSRGTSPVPSNWCPTRSSALSLLSRSIARTLFAGYNAGAQNRTAIACRIETCKLHNYLTSIMTTVTTSINKTTSKSYYLGNTSALSDPYDQTNAKVPLYG